MTARPNANLGPQFYTGDEIASLHATDWHGTIGDRHAEEHLVRNGAEIYGSVQRSQGHLFKVRDEISESGGHINEPASIVHTADGRRLVWDGHHRALTAHQFDLPLPVQHYTEDEMRRRG